MAPWIFLICVAAPFVIWFAVVAEHNRQRELAENELSVILARLRDNAGDLKAATALQEAIRQLHFSRLKTSHSGLAYQAVLECLEQNPASIKAKTIVLDVGRWHHARCREEQVTTIFDESAIQNDILVRCQMLPEAAKQEVG